MWVPVLFASAMASGLTGLLYMLLRKRTERTEMRLRTLQQSSDSPNDPAIVENLRQIVQTTLPRVGQTLVPRQHKVGRALIGLGHVLLDFGALPLGRYAERTLVFVQSSGKQGEQAGLAGAIAPDQADFFARVQGHAGFAQQHSGAPAQFDPVQDDHA